MADLMERGRITIRQTGTWAGDVVCAAFDEDGQQLAMHVSSGLSWARHDMGITSDWKHDAYAARYPQGYDLVDALSTSTPTTPPHADRD